MAVYLISNISVYIDIQFETDVKDSPSHLDSNYIEEITFEKEMLSQLPLNTTEKGVLWPCL